MTEPLLWSGVRSPWVSDSVADGLEFAFHTPDWGQISPVRTRVPTGLRVIVDVAIVVYAFLKIAPEHQGGD
jgi:hypothetical protein